MGDPSLESQVELTDFQTKMGDRGTNWMHTDGTANEGIDRDSYLMGKKVDKAFEQFLKQQMKEEKIARTTIDGEREADIYNKRLEDPLANIRKSEKSMKERLLANPVKMKKMKAIFEEMLKEKMRGQEEKRSQKDEKKKKKESTKSRKRKVSSHSDSDDADAEFERKRMEEHQKQLMRLKHSGLGEAPGTSKNWNQAERYKSSYANRLVNKDDDPNYVRVQSKSRDDEEKREKKGKKSSKKSKKSKKSDKKSQEDEVRAAKRAEMEKKRQAMMDNASEYQTNRERKAADSKLKQEAEDASERDADGKRKGAAFLGDVKMRMAGGQTMEQRIRSRKGMQQRRDVDFDKNQWKG